MEPAVGVCPDSSGVRLGEERWLIGDRNLVREAGNYTEPGGLRDAAARILVACFPLLLADTVRRAHPTAFHQFQLLPPDGGGLAPGLVEDDSHIVATTAWVDLSTGPVLLRFPPAAGRYFNLTLFDTAGEPFASLGSRSGDDSGVDLVLAGPQWRGGFPVDVAAKRAPSEGVWVVSRFHAHSGANRSDTVKLAERQRIEPLQAGAHGGRMVVDPFQPPSAPCLQQVMQTTAGAFFQRLDSVLGRGPEYSTKAALTPIVALRRELGGPPPTSGWGVDFARALDLGVSDGLTAIRIAADCHREAKAPGWRLARPLENDGQSVLGRAVRAYAGMGARVRADLLALVCDRDDSGQPLSGANCYRVRFPVGCLPPARRGWRLATSPAAPGDVKEGLSDGGHVVPGSKGSLDVIVGRAPRAISAAANWLPAPDGPFSLVMRLCWPRPAALSGAWTMPPVKRLEPARDASPSHGREFISQAVSQ